MPMRLACAVGVPNSSNPVDIFGSFTRQKNLLMPGTFFLVGRFGLDGESAAAPGMRGKRRQGPPSASIVEFGVGVAARKSRQGNLPTASQRIAQ
jgi:hypothetical protein